MSLAKPVRIIDADGHLMEDAAAIFTFLPKPYKEIGIFNRPTFPYRNLFPVIDHLHTSFRESPATRSDRPRTGPEEWLAFLDDVGIETTVLYPSSALGYGRIAYVDEAIALTRAYNEWLASSYLALNPRFKGVGILPMQDPEVAAQELRRIVKTAGMPGAMLPANGLKAPLGHKDYWPVYRAADELGCAIGIHGGVHSGLGLDHMQQFQAVHALGHPFGVMVSFASIISGGVLDRFPGARFGFLEAGVAWMFLVIERLEGSNKSFYQPNPRGHLLRLGKSELAGDYIQRHIDAGRITIGCEGDEPTIAYAVKTVGNKPFLFSSDFPHEVTNETCKEEVHELLESKELTKEDKDAIMWKNAARFYQLNGKAR